MGHPLAWDDATMLQRDWGWEETEVCRRQGWKCSGVGAEEGF